MEAATTWPRTADPTLDIQDGPRVAQVTVRLGETAIAAHRIEPARPVSRTSVVLHGGWAVLALAPLAVLVGLPGLTAALALLGLGCGLLGTLVRRAGRSQSELTIGSAPDVDVPLGTPSLRRFSLVTASPKGLVLHLPPGLTGELDGQRLEARSFPIPSDARIVVRLGQTTLAVASVAPARQLKGAQREVPWREPLCQAGSFAVHAAVVIAALLASPAKRTQLPQEVRKNLVRLRATWVPSFRGDPVLFHPSFVRARDPHIGNTRSPDAPPGLYALRGPRNNPDPHLARRLGEQAARAGVLGLLQQGGAGFGGHPVRAPHGVPRVVVGQPEVRGALDRQVVRRLITRHLGEVKFCFIHDPVDRAGGRWYEPHRGALPPDRQARPTLAGRATVAFLIGHDGRVRRSRIAASTLQHPGVEACLARAARRWLFPRSHHGVVAVSVPYLFRVPE